MTLKSKMDLKFLAVYQSNIIYTDKIIADVYTLYTKQIKTTTKIIKD